MENRARKRARSKEKMEENKMKLNIYKKARKKIREFDQSMDHWIIVSMDGPNGQKVPVCINVPEARKYRDTAMELRGILEVCDDGLKDGSKFYKDNIERLDAFIERISYERDDK